MAIAGYISEIIEILKNYKEQIGAAHDVIVGVAALVGGLWVILRLNRERTDEEALTIDLACRSSPYGEEYLVCFDVRLCNVGKTKIQAKRKRAATEYVYDDGIEQLEHSGSLQLRRIAVGAIPDNGRRINWFDGGSCLEKLANCPDINLLSYYENPKKGNRVEFWMEPGEIYNLEASVILPPGLYLTKVTFVASKSDLNFWTRVMQVCVAVPELPCGSPVT
jgi:hypothetical protein